MQLSRRARSKWTAVDQATYEKWRRLMIMLYGAVGLVLLFGIGTYHFIPRAWTVVSSVQADADSPKR